MSKSTVLVCGKMFDGLGDALSGPVEILVEDEAIAAIGESVGRPANSTVIDLSNRTVTPGFIDTHVHLFLDGMNLRVQIPSVQRGQGPLGSQSGATVHALWLHNSARHGHVRS